MWILKQAIESIAIRDHGENNIPSHGVLVYVSDEVPSSTAEGEKADSKNVNQK